MSQQRLRILGYVVTLALHVGNVVYMASNSRRKDLEEDIEVMRFIKLQNRYLTFWSFFMQIIYAITGLCCELLTMTNSSNQDYKLPKYLKGFRDTLFAAIVWPISIYVCTVFWPIVICERSLMFPVYIDKIISPVSNHIMHTAIAPIVIWEIILRPRTLPKSHVPNLTCLALFLGLYTCAVFYTKIENDFWIYPVLEMLDGTVYFYLFIAFLCTLTFIFYYIQWYITEFIWGPSEKPKEN